MTPEITRLVAAIGETVGRFAATADVMITPRLRRENRIRSIQGSLAIEQNSLSLDQVTAVIQGRRVLGAPREIQEVRNAFAAYEALSELVAHGNGRSAGRPSAAHGQGWWMKPGVFRRGRVGVFKDQQVVHVAPPGSTGAETHGGPAVLVENHAGASPDRRLPLPLRTGIHPSLCRRQRPDGPSLADPDPEPMAALVRLCSRGVGGPGAAGGLLRSLAPVRPAGRRHSALSSSCSKPCGIRCINSLPTK